MSNNKRSYVYASILGAVMAIVNYFLLSVVGIVEILPVWKRVLFFAVNVIQWAGTFMAALYWYLRTLKPLK